MRWILLAALCLAPAAGAEDFERTLALGEGERVVVALERGDVEIATHPGASGAGTVWLGARARGQGASAVHFEVDAAPGSVRLHSRSEPWLAWLDPGPRVRVLVIVPEGTPVEVETPGQVVRRDPGARFVRPVVAASP